MALVRVEFGPAAHCVKRTRLGQMNSPPPVRANVRDAILRGKKAPPSPIPFVIGLAFDTALDSKLDSKSNNAE